jgi:hypothetical protein
VILARLTRDLPAYLRSIITPELATSIVKRWLAMRADRFLELSERFIYGYPRSPYRRLLRLVGCEFGDLRALVMQEGVEGTLLRLADIGVSVSFDEFRGTCEIVRGSERFTPVPSDFDNHLYPPHFVRWSGGSTGQAVAVGTSLHFMTDGAIADALAHQAHGVSDVDHVFWLTGPVDKLLRHARAGMTPLAWFHPLQPLPWKVRAAAGYLQVMGRWLGRPFPRPVWSDLQDPALVIDWIARRLALGRSVCMTTFPSSAVRIATAASERGLSLDRVCFDASGEPLTESKRRAIEAAGARVLGRYGSLETATIAYGCATPHDCDDLHLFSDRVALIQQSRALDGLGVAVQAFLFTTLEPSASKILFNFENGDHGRLERRACACQLGALGLHDHLSEVRSHEKLTTEGVTFIRTRLLPLLEELLPDRFGGASADYQLVEQDDGDGIGRLYLLVHPRLNGIDAVELKRIFLRELGRGDELQQHMASLWERAATVEVRREAPRPTSSGKIPLFRVLREREP